MRAITVREPGGPEVLRWAPLPDPRPAEGEVVVNVTASAVNRADLLQRQGRYRPPRGASNILGLECSGTVAALGRGVTGWRVGDEVCALLAGGGYAEKVAVPAEQLMPVPGGVDLVTAAGLPEVACTVWSNLVDVARLAKGEVLLVHGGAGGVGTFAIQLGRALGATVATTAGSEERLARCRELGAEILVNHREQDFVEEVARATGGRGADVVLDNIGAKYLGRNIEVLAVGGRLVVIGMQGGRRAEVDLSALLAKRASVSATALRGRPVTGPGGKAGIVADVVARVWPLLADGTIRPVVHDRIPMAEAGRAHELLDGGTVVGKVLLTV
ncbi:NAD(P)H-quinone oxidoreductase [Actinoalloteichus sp. AHMU CJ021]|uniref:NAD(P)H quinone oxidoreductase, PIG3 family n=1 Tax=Actinoalloteichus caeruleus DSM 43889 TaxID=1120930 RepID=A0ABT1JJW6_ACTCY|nr:NAD(P)H-quinone oxidoreductase [Actinoalloteichus caeruleus]AUS78657.1 NAD(P)H-quinone oxidoreductase [Actinoalloteichus sp. AHMU CJ021]MCP2332795.1 putative NAD(P)H quinone oxidoreductase, PIG3 family [Actinoalloteichus caeruleus DSM 43889]